MAPSCPRYSFRLLLPGVLGFGSVRHEPCPTTNFLIVYFRWREGVPTSVSGSQPIVWLLSSSPLAWRSVRATICHPVSHSFSIRSPSTNIYFSILTWICYFGIDPHSYDVLTVILWWLATVNSNTRIVVILFLSSQWDTTWQTKLETDFLLQTKVQLNGRPFLLQIITCRHLCQMSSWSLRRRCLYFHGWGCVQLSIRKRDVKIPSSIDENV